MNILCACAMCTVIVRIPCVAECGGRLFGHCFINAHAKLCGVLARRFDPWPLCGSWFKLIGHKRTPRNSSWNTFSASHLVASNFILFLRSCHLTEQASGSRQTHSHLTIALGPQTDAPTSSRHIRHRNIRSHKQTQGQTDRRTDRDRQSQTERDRQALSSSFSRPTQLQFETSVKTLTQCKRDTKVERVRPCSMTATIEPNQDIVSAVASVGASSRLSSKLQRDKATKGVCWKSIHTVACPV